MYNETIQPWASFYPTSNKWRVFPVHSWDTEKSCCTCGKGDCPNPGKHPATKNGFRDASVAGFVVDSWFREGNRNIGLATGKGSGVFVLDVDGEAGLRSLRALEEEHGKLPKTLICMTGSGQHIYFQMPDVDVPCSTSKVGDKLDIRGDGGYTILPPSMHRSGVEYRWVDVDQPVATAPDWLVKMATAEKKKASATSAPASAHGPGSYMHTVIESAVNALDPDLPYDQWLRAGMAIKAAGGSFEIWDSWSAKGEKYNTKEMRSKWDSFDQIGGVTGDTIEWMAREVGWENPYHKSVTIDMDAIRKSWDERERQARRANELGLNPDNVEAPTFDGWPFNPLKLDGLIGETVRWVTETSLLPQPHLALLATLATMGGVTGRKYALQDLKTRTNIYLAGLARTGAGKDHARKRMAELAQAAGFGGNMGHEDFISAPGLMRALHNKPSQVMLVDEIGMVFRAMGSNQTPGFRRDIVPLLLKLYSSSGTSAFTNGEYADEKRKGVSISHPCLSLYGTSTRETYAESLKAEMVQSGELNRWIVLPGDDTPPINTQASITPPPDHVVAGWMRVADFEPPKTSSTDITSSDSPERAPEPIVVKVCETAAEMKNGLIMQGYEESQRKSRSAPMWVRFFENSMKIAMMLAIARDPVRPVIIQNDLQVAASMVEASIRYVVTLVEQDAYEDEYEKKMNRLTSYIEEETRARGYTTLTQISRKFGKTLRRKLRDEIIQHLEDQAKIEVRLETPESGRPFQRISYVD